MSHKIPGFELFNWIMYLSCDKQIHSKKSKKKYLKNQRLKSDKGYIRKIGNIKRLISYLNIFCKKSSNVTIKDDKD